MKGDIAIDLPKYKRKFLRTAWQQMHKFWGRYKLSKPTHRDIQNIVRSIFITYYNSSHK